MSLWKCTVCGMLMEGETAPEKCPKCGAPQDKFEAVSQEDAQKITSSDRTNDIHMQIIGLAMQITELAKEGVEINLDPPCVAVFNNAIQEARIIKQRSKAELAGHMSRGKW
ncbi:MAG: rubredoxin-like domain-containing protein [Bacillota bacterium]